MENFNEMPVPMNVNRAQAYTSKGDRENLEDFFAIVYHQGDLFDFAFFGIYDGHGGSEAASYAKEHLMDDIVNQKLFWSENDQDVLKAIRKGFFSTQCKMWREHEKWPKTSLGLPSTAGTTASIAFIRHGKIYIGHVGDSGIVLGYKDEDQLEWKGRQLTQEHKPESNVERTRIIESGGKVAFSKNVWRVVWALPQLQHKGPVLRNTPIIEIPFLNVARSLGDFWSFNPGLNKFIVSPEPDVSVIPIHPNFRCLIFGSDGLWNMVSADTAVETVQKVDMAKQRQNPSKELVIKALERWKIAKFRADNTSVITIMLDSPASRIN